MPYPNLNPPIVDETVPPHLRDRIISQMGGPRPEVSQAFSLWGFPIGVDAASRSKQAASAWDEEYNTRLRRELNPLSVGQVSEPYRSQLATPNQYQTHTTTVPHLSPEALQAPSTRQGQPQLFGPMTPEAQPNPYALTPGPHTYQELDVNKPANPAQRQSFESSIALQSKWPPGYNRAIMHDRQMDDSIKALVARGMSPDEARDQALYIHSGVAKDERAAQKENRLGTSAERRMQHMDEQERVASERLQLYKDSLDLQRKQFKHKLDTYNHAKTTGTDPNSLAAQRLALQRDRLRLTALWLEAAKNPELDEDAVQELHKAMLELGQMDLTEVEQPGALGGLLPSTKKQVVTPKKGAAPTGPQPSGQDIVTDSQGKQWKYKGSGPRTDKNSYTPVN